jgi:hypothetical protein
MLAGLLLFGMAADARADIIFSINQGSIQPDENVLFNEPGLISGPAMTITGATNNTGLEVSFTSDENLVSPPLGAARVTAEDGAIDNFVTVDTVDNTLFFSEFEANVRIVANAAGTGSVLACNQFAVCEIFVLEYAGGENFFVLSVLSPQLIDTVTINSGGTVDILDLRQIRVSIATGEGEEVTVPEPGSLALMGLAFVLGARRFRRNGAAV